MRTYFHRTLAVASSNVIALLYTISIKSCIPHFMVCFIIVILAEEQSILLTFGGAS